MDYASFADAGATDSIPPQNTRHIDVNRPLSSGIYGPGREMFLGERNLEA